MRAREKERRRERERVANVCNGGDRGAAKIAARLMSHGITGQMSWTRTVTRARQAERTGESMGDPFPEFTNRR
ncbi:hypothetical protein R1flu_004622 [Riccia fluitans]|uniref:Uncharacterized protein n=1 Tax=Riccia fluitans TaxID=41844 RepID=A0ABD1YRG3_9MARC